MLWFYTTSGPACEDPEETVQSLHGPYSLVPCEDAVTTTTASRAASYGPSRHSQWWHLQANTAALACTVHTLQWTITSHKRASSLSKSKPHQADRAPAPPAPGCRGAGG